MRLLHLPIKRDQFRSCSALISRRLAFPVDPFKSRQSTACTCPGSEHLSVDIFPCCARHSIIYCHSVNYATPSVGDRLDCVRRSSYAGRHLIISPPASSKFKFRSQDQSSMNEMDQPSCSLLTIK